jgi:Fe/S biogenesis protein NfuA
MVSSLGGNRDGDGRTERPARPLVHFTASAQEKVLELLKSKGFLGSGALRISVKNPGFGAPEYGMALEENGEPDEGDTVIRGDGFHVLVDQQSLPLVNGARVDFVDQLLQRGFRVEAPAAPPPMALGPVADLDLSDPNVASVQRVLQEQVNPGIASHGGMATLLDVRDNIAYVALGGGCQGCSMASVTLKQGVERMIKEAVPEIISVVDATDHASGSNPFYQGEKGGASPYATSSKG